MPKVTKVMKLHIKPDSEDAKLLLELMEAYRSACNYISQYIFDNGFILNSVYLNNLLYQVIREDYGLKSQLTQSAIRTVTARYSALDDVFSKNPFKYKDENGDWQYIRKTLDCLWQPVMFSRPQADLVRGRDYSFVNGRTTLSMNTLNKRIKVAFDIPANFEKYFDTEEKWSFGTGKIVQLLGEWYFHISMTKEIEDEFSRDHVKHVVGMDRGLRFLATTYDEKGKTKFFNGKDVLYKRNTFNKVRAQLQSKGTKSAKRVLKRISGRENRWMTDVNHQLSKTLVDQYGSDTLFVLEDLTGVSFSDRTLAGKSKEGRNEIRSWAFYQLEQFLTYKAEAVGSKVIEVPAQYTSQRCPKCGRINKENRHHDIHEYICDCCGYRSNDDRIGAMNLQELGKQYISGDEHPKIVVKKSKKKKDVVKPVIPDFSEDMPF